MNIVVLCGNLCSDGNVSYGENNQKLYSNSIAVNRDYKNKITGEYDPDFITIWASGNNAEYLSKYAGKGTKVVVNGSWFTKTYTKKDGTTAYNNICKVNSVKIVSNYKNENATNIVETDDEPTFDTSDLPF